MFTKSMARLLTSRMDNGPDSSNAKVQVDALLDPGPALHRPSAPKLFTLPVLEG